MKIFAVSDIHSFYTYFKKALDKSGFEVGNKNHLLIVLGDCFDRGDESQETLDFLMSVPNKVLIRGNHEYLIEEFCRRGYPLSHDHSNGTSKTVMDLDLEAKNWDAACETTMTKLKPLLNQMVNYFETDKYIFVHSWIPCIGDGKPMYHVRNRHFEYDPNWRNAHQAQWEGATWGNPLTMAEKGLNQTGKIIVCGHWHCSSGWAKEAGIPEFGYGSCCEPYYYKDKLIMIDACTAATKVVNVLVLEDGLIE